MEDGIIPEPLLSFKIDGLEDLEDLLWIQETDDGFLKFLLRYVEDVVCQFEITRIHEPEHFGKGFEGSKAAVSGSGRVFALFLKVNEE